jgi:hypothetical protein
MLDQKALICTMFENDHGKYLTLSIFSAKSYTFSVFWTVSVYV